MPERQPLPEAPHWPAAALPAPRTDPAAEPDDDWLGVESTHPLTWLPTVAGAITC